MAEFAYGVPKLQLVWINNVSGSEFVIFMTMQKQVQTGFEMKIRQLWPVMLLLLNFFTVALGPGPAIRVEQQALSIGAKAAVYTSRNTRIYYKNIYSRLRALRFFCDFLKSSLAQVLQGVSAILQVQLHANRQLCLKLNALIWWPIVSALFPLSRGRIIFSLT